MNIVIISEYTIPELYMIDQVVRKYPETVVIVPQTGANFGPFYKKKGWLKHLVNGVTWKLHRELWIRKFYPDRKFPAIPNTAPVVWEQLNKQTGIDTLKRLSPDILIVNRAPILSMELIQVPKLAAVNIHAGIAPHYRGNDTLFWPLYKNDFQHIGGCIHHLTQKLDMGNVLVEVYPALKPTDGEISVEYKTVQLLTLALLDLIKVAEDGNCELTGKPQTATGRNYSRNERTFWISVYYILRRAIGLSSPPKRKEKIIAWYNIKKQTKDC